LFFLAALGIRSFHQTDSTMLVECHVVACIRNELPDWLKISFNRRCELYEMPLDAFVVLNRQQDVKNFWKSIVCQNGRYIMDIIQSNILKHQLCDDMLQRGLKRRTIIWQLKSCCYGTGLWETNVQMTDSLLKVV